MHTSLYAFTYKSCLYSVGCGSVAVISRVNFRLMSKEGFSGMTAYQHPSVQTLNHPIVVYWLQGGPDVKQLHHRYQCHGLK